MLDIHAGERPIFLIGHSMGAILTLRMAAHPLWERLGDIDVAGVPLQYGPEMKAVIDHYFATGERTKGDVNTLRAMFYGPDGSYNPAYTVEINRLHTVPALELADAFRAPSVLPSLMMQIKVPVQWTIAEHERSSIGGHAMLDRVTKSLPSAKRVLTHLQINSGHNISVHHVARAYHTSVCLFLKNAD